MKITTTKDHDTKLKVLVYGQSGIGKTFLASTVPHDKCLVVSAEGGTLSIDKFNIAMLDLTRDESGKPLDTTKRYEELRKAYAEVIKPQYTEQYEWLFIDSLTEISQNVVENLQTVYTDAKDNLKLWSDYSKATRAMIKRFRDLPYYNVVFTALETVDQDESGRRFTRPNMQGSIGKNLCGYFDLVFWYHKDKDDRRMFLTCPMDTIQAKDRSGQLNQVEEPNLSQIQTKILEGTRL
jgi:phage nucleotide-binding protein